ncbi:uncharacterized protein BDR25DRAFT_309372 [Lindgomyces ingoldianus]|uniref:Uncharacterized protein n=1 Tax=Lindgomyces ingoldianus TaxID=673940 RepID=A0ACB6RDE4_9PLEO|nr:uncharacterized protein BDR25DRAFT_309372 [Lindgomyces ingoldianus]KAF2477060.1 hypothetical protein BDR25DRAFT_309372 [Lindgomyces ingoldianus]
MASHDPRSSSTQSLVPDPAFDFENTSRRRLLLIYIHGFMGNETSFQSFPAHVHNLVTITLAQSHTVHTKIYPRYKSRDSLELRRDDFSNWLAPHETSFTDIVLLGHSMGGLLAADIALLFRHHIIGIVNFDVPFLGMHPGIVKAGLGSIFKPAPPPQHHTLEEFESNNGKRPSRMNTLFNPKPTDPNYNPSFYNDINLPVRKGWENALHFMNKHSNGLISASKGLVKSHFEFGSAMADYRGLKDRYARIRALEEDDERKRQSANPEVPSPPRIRFVNYYTASTGRLKKPKTPSPSRPASRASQHELNSTAGLTSDSQLALTAPPAKATTASPRISIEEHRDDEVVPVSPEEPLSAISPMRTNESIGPTTTTLERNTGPNLPDIPPIPKEPPFVDLAQYSDKAERKTAEKDHTRALKEYQRAVKARNGVIKQRSRIEEKWEKQERKGQEVANKAENEHGTDSLEEDLSVHLGGANYSQDNNRNDPYNSYDFSHSAILAQAAPEDRFTLSESTPPSTQSSYTDSVTTLTTQDTNTSNPSPSASSPKPRRYKKFCMLPPKDANGNKDPAWTCVFMEDMDEVSAHCGLFFMSETYERLVGDVAARIEEWVSEAESLRVVREMDEWSMD